MNPRFSVCSVMLLLPNRFLRKKGSNYYHPCHFSIDLSMSGDDSASTGEGRGALQDRLYNGFHSMVDHAIVYANFILAFLMVAIAVAFAIRSMNGLVPFKVTLLIANISLFVCGLLILLDRDRSLPTSVGLVAIGLGLYRVFTAASLFVYHSYFNIIWLVMVILGLNTMLSGRAYLKGKTRARVTMILAMSLLTLINILFIVYMYVESKDVGAILENYPHFVLLTVMYVIFIIILDSEKLRSRDWMEVHERTMAGICRTYHIDSDAEIECADAQALVRGIRDRCGWDSVADGGPVLHEHHSLIKNHRGISYLIAQEWAGADVIYVTMADCDSGTILQSSRFQVSEAELDDGSLRLISPDGSMVQIAVVEEFQWYRSRIQRRSTLWRSWASWLSR